MARTDLEQLQFQMSADISKMEKQLKKALDQVNGTSDKIEKRMKKTGEGANLGKALDAIFDRSRFALIEEGGAKLSVFGSALEHLGPAGLIAAAGLAAVGIGLEGTEKALEYADAIYKTAANAHVSAEALQEYQFALRAVGGNADEAGGALASFSTQLGRAKEGMPRALKQFEALGFTEQQIKSWKDAETALPIVAEAISRLKSNDLKDAAIAGTGLEGMKLLIEAGPERMREYLDEARSAGNVMEESLVKRGHALNEEMETLKKKVGVELASAFVDLGPILVSLTKLLAGMAGWVQHIVDGLSSVENKSDDGLRARLAEISMQNARFGLNPEPAQKAIIERNNAERASIEFELQRRDAANKPPAAGGGDGTLKYPTKQHGPTAADKRAKGQEALDQAQQRELAAQAALTDNVEEILRLKSEEVDRELSRKNTALSAEIADGKIDAALARQAIAENVKAADLEKEKLRRDAEEKLDDQFFADQQKAATAYDKIAQINAAMATTVQARLVIERAALLQRQKEQREELQRQFDREKSHGNFNQSRADMLTATQRDQQSAELRQLEHGAATDLAGDFKDLLSGAVDALRNKKNVMEYLADSFGEKLLSNLEDAAAQWLAKQFLQSQQGSFLATIGQVLGHRAAGGNVRGGQAYEVGEVGREIFVPGVSGTILPNRLLGAGVSGGRGAVYLSMPIDARGAMMAQDFIDYVDRSKSEAIHMGAALGVSGAAQIVPARMQRAARQRYR